jgi:hypothetical protein
VQRFNAEVMQLWQWDDHEVSNNWSAAKDLSADKRYTEKNVPLLVARGTRAFLENAPMRWHGLDEEERVYRKISAASLPGSASMRLTTSTRHRPRDFATSIIRRVPYSTPDAAFTTTHTVSTAEKADNVGPRKSAKPGVSTRLTWMPAWSVDAMAVLSECPRVFSIGSWSETVVPRSTLPADWIAPPACNKASNNVVLPLPECPAIATLRICAVL